VLWVANGQAALDALAKHPESFQVVFSDISMPGMSGIELFGEIQARYPWLPVVLTSGYNDEYAHLDQEQTRRFDVLQKPYSTDALSALLQRVVRDGGQ